MSNSFEEEKVKPKRNISFRNDPNHDYPNIYESEANNYIVYISLIDIETDNKINFSYYLCELLSLILKNKEAHLLNNVKKNEDLGENILTCANLNRAFAVIKKNVMGLMKDYSP